MSSHQRLSSLCSTHTNTGDYSSSESEYECESGGEQVQSKEISQRKFACDKSILDTPTFGVCGTHGHSTVSPSSRVIRWPERLVAAKNGLGEPRLTEVDRPYYYMMLDVETSGPIWGVNSVLAVAGAVMSVVLKSDRWEVRIVEVQLFVYPQDDVVFDPSIIEPGGFWHLHKEVLDSLAFMAKVHGATKEQVTQSLVDWWDNAMKRHDYPQVWSDNPVFDIGLISMMCGLQLKRRGLAYVRHPEYPDEYLYARPALHTSIICMDLIHPHLLSMADFNGAPSLMNHALKHQALGALSSLVHNHNPLNDVQRLAINFGRLLCKWAEVRSISPTQFGMPIYCYTLDSKEPLHAERPRAVRFNPPPGLVMDRTRVEDHSTTHTFGGKRMDKSTIMKPVAGKMQPTTKDQSKQSKSDSETLQRPPKRRIFLIPEKTSQFKVTPISAKSEEKSLEKTATHQRPVHFVKTRGSPSFAKTFVKKS